MKVKIMKHGESYFWRIVDIDNDSIWYAESRDLFKNFSDAFESGDYYLDSM